MEFIFKFMAALLVAIMPPHVAEDPYVYKWRQTVALVILVLSATQVAHIAMACGLIPGWDTGFAKASEVGQIVAKQNQQSELIISDQIRTSLEKWCSSATNAMAMRYQRETLESLLHEYANEHQGQNYVLPTCQQLGFN